MAWEQFDHLGISEERLDQAARQAVDDVTAAAAIYAKQNHPGWNNVTGLAEGSIRMEPAVDEGERVVGYFGSYDVNYFIWLEIGANGHPGDYTLRRAADAEFPSLGRRLAQRIGGLKA